MKTILLIIIAFIYIKVTAQNLVTNGSFELNNSYQINLSISEGFYPGILGWWSANNQGTVDCLSKYSTNMNSGIPINSWVYQYPRTGNNYVGITTYSEGEPNAREYIETHLAYPLINGKTYQLKFYASLYDSLPGGFCVFYSNKNIIAINSLGAFFSTSKLDTAGVSVIRRTPQIKATTFLTDTAGWTEINGLYTALGGEQYLTIGNFYDDVHTPKHQINNHTPNSYAASYYVIDDVSLEDASGMENIVEEQAKISIAPNPANDNITISIPSNETGFNSIYQLRIYNSLGQLLDKVQMNFTANSCTYNTSYLPNGNYIAILNNTAENYSIKFSIGH